MIRISLVIIYRNGVRSTRYESIPAAYEAANRISFAGGKVQRVELDLGESKRALWDEGWTDESKRAGLTLPA